MMILSCIFCISNWNDSCFDMLLHHRVITWGWQTEYAASWGRMNTLHKWSWEQRAIIPTPPQKSSGISGKTCTLYSSVAIWEDPDRFLILKRRYYFAAPPLESVPQKSWTSSGRGSCWWSPPLISHFGLFLFSPTGVRGHDNAHSEENNLEAVFLFSCKTLPAS